ncbi:flagellar biosynthesis protein FlhA [Tardibacter chloracetimidivorans]|uniref:Flagellar biosynthesis protein FlhA n=2 Tax=Tardibacter chloracetimidivorans TaxID=1921510 RepID=A0A1L3ZZH7_9SPHN|nr:flagellar biosynthesis protein FlhA [Tardibacter chloracetimidivorans]
MNRTIWAGAGRAAMLPLGILLLVVLMVVPIAPFLLDVFFILNIMIALAVLMVSLNTQKPLDFSSFPTVLLFATLLRLALNVASTRVVLVNGHTGPDAAGQVIEAFGHFLIGGDYVVGLFVFMILIIINLVVITKGAGRVSEVSARFTLDALPGKQMAIDADLNAGLLTPDEAKSRRQEVATEADFYGSMDGASKFVKGDAIAGLLILAVNIIGGLILGTVQHGLTMAEAGSNYILLAIGDGLVAQVPALMLSIAAAVIVTRVSSPLDLTGQMSSQFGSAAAWTPVAAILALLGVLPGMPQMIILPAAGLAAYAAWRLKKAQSASAAPETADAAVADPARESQINWEDVTDNVQISVEIGYGLIGLVDEKLSAPLMGRLTGIRRQLSREFGFVVPPIRVRDNMSLAPHAYRVLVSGVVHGEDEVSPNDMLALDSGLVHASVSGRAVKDPTFGLEALWIPAEQKDQAVASGYTVVDASTVVATHVNQILQSQSCQLLGQDEVQKLLDTLQAAAPQLVGNITKALSLQTITQVLQTLLDESVPVRDFRRIVEALAGAAHRTQDPAELTELIRPALGGLIVQRLCGLKDQLKIITLDGDLEQLLVSSVRADPSGAYPLDPALSQRILTALGEAAKPLLADGTTFAVVTTPLVRRPLFQLLRQHLPDVTVLSFYEIPDSRQVQVVAVVGRGTE